MKVPEGVKVYGLGRQRFKAGQELPVHMMKIKGIEKSIEKAGNKYAEGKKQDSKIEKKPESFGSSLTPKKGKEDSDK
jgi:hypothetical protein